MDNKIITADGVNIDVDKHEDEKTKERRLMAYAFKMVRAESGMNRKNLQSGLEFLTEQCRSGNWEEGLCHNMYWIL